MFVLGIVGSPAGGKSTVAQRLQELGAEWINADLVARGVLEQEDVQSKLIDQFGDEITGSNGRIDRGKLASLVFGDDDASREALKYLEGVLHPRTGLEINERLRESADRGVVAVVLDVPLLFKSGWDQTCDEIWCVDADRSIRMKRAADRDWDPNELARREANQVSIEEKKRLSNFVILNDGSLDDLHETVDRLWTSFLNRNAERTPPSSSHCP